ncbi:amidohydrolase, imidazolonepropionase [Desulfosporosinus orientis DSM 765]|uniref:Amidohydrolase, imidazolonepropionase n=1 Tax=Desulfosporosinus orientis (strain ATCC 19365 / DSM 765 / NCIMB 8382 / VKM B-1628 / Singapore I) TaxID=768706 RepID=G7WGZ8_DESOD|nr:amidohydrolase family protein [Desulfosporosinus orientis]AET69012.1 amidohydrolase, imidazolonepropionase [Desulfosporosinus orientis DSM 765]
MYISCSAEQRTLEIPDKGEMKIAGYWSPQLGLYSQPVLLQWEAGKVSSLQPLEDYKTIYKGREEWHAYFLLPGWIDSHVHLSLDSLDFFQCLENWNQPALIEKNVKLYLQSYLDNGIIAIRDGGDLPGFAWQAKNKVKEGLWQGPEVVSVHEAVGRAGMYGRFLGRGFPDLSKWRKNEKDFFAQGLDQLKVIVTGLIRFDDFHKVGPSQWTVKELKELVKTAHDRGILVMAHASGEEGISLAIEANVDSIEHGYYMTTDQLELMREKGIAWVPTVAPIGNILKYPSNRYSAHEIDTLKRILDRQLETICKAYSLGVRLGVGTDAGAYQVPHGESLSDELDWMIKAGIPKLEVYRRATSENAQILGRPELGRLDVGTPMNQLQLVKEL